MITRIKTYFKLKEHKNTNVCFNTFWMHKYIELLTQSLNAKQSLNEVTVVCATATVSPISDSKFQKCCVSITKIQPLMDKYDIKN